MIRVLLIPSSDYLGHPFPQRHNQIFERLHDGRDFEVHVLRFNIFGKARLSSRCVIHEFPLEYKTKSTPLYYAANAAFHVSEIMKIVRQESIDIVVAGNLLPPLLFEVSKRLSRYKVPMIFDLQDYYPTSAAGYIANVNGMVGTVFKGLFESITRTLIRSADAVTVPGVALAKYAERAGAHRVHIVPNGVSEHFLKRHDGSGVRRRLGYDEEDVVVGYVGSIEFWLDMKTLIKAVSKALNHGLSVKLLLIGKHLQTGYSKKVEEWIKEHAIERITTWMDFIPYSEVPKYIAAMNLGTIPFDVGNPTAYYAAPNKLWEYLSQGVSVVSTPIPEALAFKRFIHIARSEDDYVAALKNAGGKMDREHRLQEVRHLLESRTWEKSAERFKEIINNLIARKR
ncbi:MAG: glycosyltransferase [Infirmifilum sp.]